MDVLESVEWGRAPKRSERQMAVDGCVHGKDELWEIHEEAGLLSPDKAASTLGDVLSKTVEGHHKSRNVKNVADKKTFTIKLKNSCPPTEDWDERIVAHANGEPRHCFVADEAQLVRDHMIRGSRVGHCKTTVW